jgi:hypothetical protein
MSDQLFGFSESPPTRGTGMVPEPKYAMVHAIYLASIAVATIGWLWLIVWGVMQSIRL